MKQRSTRQAGPSWLGAGLALAALYLLKGRRQQAEAAPNRGPNLPQQPVQRSGQDDKPWINAEDLADQSSPLQSGPVEFGGQQPSTAPGVAHASAGADDLGYDSPPVTSSDISNTEVAGYDHMTPVYPPGGGGDELEDSASAETPQRDKNDRPAL